MPRRVRPEADESHGEERALKERRNMHERSLNQSEKTNSMPPQDVYRARSGSVVPRSRTSNGKLAATSPAMSKPMSPPMPAYTATYCLPSGPVYVIGAPTIPDPTLN